MRVLYVTATHKSVALVLDEHGAEVPSRVDLAKFFSSEDAERHAARLRVRAPGAYSDVRVEAREESEAVQHPAHLADTEVVDGPGAASKSKRATASSP